MHPPVPAEHAAALAARYPPGYSGHVAGRNDAGIGVSAAQASHILAQTGAGGTRRLPPHTPAVL